MPTLLRARHHSIGTKIFAAFVAMGLLTGALGLYGLYMLTAAGRIAIDIYDRPLMAINFARSASLTFSLMDKDALRRRLVPADQQSGLDRDLDELSQIFFDDLKIADERALAADEHVVIIEIHKLVEEWNALRQAPVPSEEQLDALAKRIVSRFDVLIELIAEQSFLERRKAVKSISTFTYMGIGATLAALLLSAAITILLARRIVRPLSAAARVADRIAEGELQTPIPVGGLDEAGALLRSMTVMQDNLRVLIEREMAQRRSAQVRLIDALETLREGILLIDAEGRIAVVNSEVRVYFPEIAALLVPGADFRAIFAMILPRLKREELLQETVLPAPLEAVGGEYKLENGRWMHISRADIRDGGFILLLSDFTEVKAREERLREASEQAQAANKAKTTFLANMSHELRTPLNAIIGFSEILTGQVFGAIGNDKYVEYSGNILSSGRNLLGIINGVLDLARSEASGLVLEPMPVDLNDIVEACADEMRDQCRETQLDLRVVVPPTPLLVMAEEAKLRQVFGNLLSNAIKFNKPGGRIDLAVRALANGGAQVRLTDTGIGMTETEIQTALEPFSQVDTRLARRYEGAGIGLPLSKALVELHGGTLSIESVPDVGTIVIVKLPKDRRASQGADAKDGAPAP